METVVNYVRLITVKDYLFLRKKGHLGAVKVSR